jgi:hypothetical protein
MPAPLSVNVRTYQVGFGDCFLLSFLYADEGEKHVLVDFGTTKLPEDAPKSRMADIAADIAKRSGGKLTAVVATHRHQDHISGFGLDVRKKGTGATIGALKPDLVLQPWTENPNAAIDAVEPPPGTGDTAKGLGSHVRSLAAMQATSAQFVAEARRNNQYLTAIEGRPKRQISFIGEDNVANPSAVRNLMSMAGNEYLHAGQTTALAAMLGLEIDILGPPTVAQHAAVKRQRARDPNEFWQLAAHAGEAIEIGDRKRAVPLFPDFLRERVDGNFPIDARWLIYRARAVRGSQMLQLVRNLDCAINNTSLILLFRGANKSLLFPGDAQIENWSYALSQPEVVAKLAEVDLYKVGHHGSLNATPKSLWAQFRKKSAKVDDEDRLRTLMSTLEHKHGSAEMHTEVPRETLVDALRKDSDLFTTQSLHGSFWHDTHLVL